MQTYYAQRASAGLLISEGTAISAQAQGYSDVPGLYGEEQLQVRCGPRLYMQKAVASSLSSGMSAVFLTRHYSPATTRLLRHRP